MNIVFVKVGGSFITYKDKPVKVNLRALSSLVKIIREVKEDVSLILGNGGGSFAHYAVLKYRNKHPSNLLAKCHQATRSLNRILVDYLVESGVWATSIQPSSIIYVSRSGFEAYIKPIEVLLENKIIPVVYGECVLSEIGVVVLSTEKIFELLAKYIKPSRIVLLTDVSGIFTCNPKICSAAELINRITPENINSVLEILKNTSTIDATGGVYSKVLSMSTFSFKTGVDVIITSGFDIESAILAIRGHVPKRATIISSTT